MLSGWLLYNWVGVEARQAIVRFLARALKPGGVAYVSYNTLPGWVQRMPLQRMLLEYVRAVPVGSDRGIPQAVDFAEALHGAGAAGLGDAGLFRHLRDPAGMTPDAHRAYLAHEYLNDGWQPLLHADVARALAAAKLTYAGSAHIFQNEPSLVLSAAQRALLGGIADPMLRESFADYCGQEAHRCDVFVRGARPLNPVRRDARLRDLGLAMIGSISLPFTIEGQGTPIVLEERVYAPILAALAEAPRRIGDLLDLPAVRAAGAPSPRDLALALVGAGVAVPVTGALDSGPLRSVLRFNRAQVAEAIAAQSPSAWLAASVGGAGLPVDAAGALLYQAVQAGAPTMEVPLLVDHLLGPMSVAAYMVDPAGMQGEVQRRSQLAQGLDHAMRTALPTWRRLGMI